VTRLFLILATAAVAAMLQAPMLWAQQPEQQNEFIPIDQLPPQDQLPAAPLLVAAYAIVVVALFVYVLSVARRLTSVQRELERLESDMKRGTRA
jgi:CcmD family protein